MTDDFADVLRRAAELPDLDTTGMSLDQQIQARIRQIVEHSTLRLPLAAFDPVWVAHADEMTEAGLGWFGEEGGPQ
jgi:hypothetical protein